MPADSASPIAVPRRAARLSIAVVERVAIERRVDVDVDAAAEGDQADLDVGVDLVDEVLRPPPWRRRAGSATTSVASIDSDTSNSSMIRPSAAVRSVVVVTGRAMATTPAASAEQLDAGDDVAAPARALRRDLVEQLDLGEAHGGGAPPAGRAT